MGERLHAIYEKYPVPIQFEAKEANHVIKNRRKLVHCVFPGHVAGLVAFAVLLWYYAKPSAPIVYREVR